MHARYVALPFAIVALLAGCGSMPVDGTARTPTPEHQRPPDSRFDPDAYSTLPAEQVEQVMKEQGAGFNNCLREAPGAYVSGVARLQFVLAPDGRVELVFVSESDIGSLKVESCLVQTARYLEFPLPPGSDRVQFIYPIRHNEAGRRVARPIEESWGYPALRARREQFRECRRTYGYDGPFHLTAYIGGRGITLSSGFHARVPVPDGFAECAMRVVGDTTFPDPGDRIVKYRALVELLADD